VDLKEIRRCPNTPPWKRLLREIAVLKRFRK
jgi:hypothetical protein